MKIIHKALGIEVELPELKTRHVEAWFKERSTMPAGNAFTLAVNMVRAAVKASMIPEMDIDEMAPAAIQFLASKIDMAVAEALTIPPE